jgi:hypothetical protein
LKFYPTTTTTDFLILQLNIVSGSKMVKLFPRRKNPPTIFGGLVLSGAVFVMGAVLIYLFGSHPDFILTMIFVAIGLILIVLAIPVYHWERNKIIGVEK